MCSSNTLIRVKELDMDWTMILKSIAPTLATAVLGPLGGVAVAAIGNAMGVSEPTQDKIAKALSNGQLTPEALAKLQELELKYKNDEAQRGITYAELAYKDVDSARNLAVQTHTITPSLLTWLIVLITLGSEGALMFNAMPHTIDDIVLGRILGTMDAALVMVLGYWFGSNQNSQRKTELLANSAPMK